jgi:type III secretory pathway component EscR
MNKFFSALVLGAFLMTPVAIQAQDQPHKYYDRDHKDYHVWNDSENTAWTRYQDENHIKAHDWKKANKKEQQAYWNWRHDHPDAH